MIGWYRPWRPKRKPSIRRPPLPELKKQKDGFRYRYICNGGPFAGQEIRLTDGNSAVFSLPRNRYGAIVRGRYECAIPTSRSGSVGVTEWRPR